MSTGRCRATPPPSHAGHRRCGSVCRGNTSTALHPGVDATVGQALAILSRLTAGVQEVVTPVSPDVNSTVMPAGAFAFHAVRGQRQAPQMYQPPVLGRLRQGAAIDTTAYIERRRELDQMRHTAGGLFAHVDLLVTLMVPLLPVLVAEARDDDASVALYARNARPFNTYGLPAVSVPCGFATNGLPIGLQIVGPPWGEESVFRLAHAYEQAIGSQRRRLAV